MSLATKFSGLSAKEQDAVRGYAMAQFVGDIGNLNPSKEQMAWMCEEIAGTATAVQYAVDLAEGRVQMLRLSF